MPRKWVDLIFLVSNGNSFFGGELALAVQILTNALQVPLSQLVIPCTQILILALVELWSTHNIPCDGLLIHEVQVTIPLFLLHVIFWVIILSTMSNIYRILVFRSLNHCRLAIAVVTF